MRRFVNTCGARGSAARLTLGALGARVVMVLMAMSLCFGSVRAYGEAADEPEPEWSSPDRISDPETTGDPRDPADLAKKRGKSDRPALPEELRDAAELDGDQVKSPFTSQVQKVTERAPKITAPRDIASQGAGGAPKSPLVQVNKSGLKPQVLKQPTGGGSIKGMGITFKTSLQTGAASLSVPLALPPGRRGLAPSLGLGYSSGGGQGVAGMGWSLGVGFIARQTDQGLPEYDGYDRFVYNGGEELVRVESFGGALPDFGGEAVWIYRSKIEGLFWRFFRLSPPEPDGSGGWVHSPDERWVAQDRDGTLYTFGDVSESRIEDPSSGRIFRWGLTQVEDVHGNRVLYEYRKVASSPGKPYLGDVFWNNHPDDPGRWQHHVELEYGPRPDLLSTYQAGFPVVTAERLVAVRVYTDYGASASQSGSRPSDATGRFQVRRYAFTYLSGRFHSLLHMVQVFGSDDQTSLPPAVFGYQEVDDQGGTTTTVSAGDLGEVSTEVRLLGASPDGSLGTGLAEIMDLDSDGLPDILYVDPTTFGNDDHHYVLGVGTVDAAGRITPYLDESRATLMGFPGFDAAAVQSRGDHQTLTNSNVQILDLDGDGVVEMVHMPRAGTYQIYSLDCVRLPPGNPGAQPPENPRKCKWKLLAEVAGHPSIDLTVDAEEIRLVDVNGDGLTDVVRTAGTRLEHWINLGRYTTNLGDPSAPRAEGRFGSVLPDGTLSDQPITSCLLYKGGYIRFSDPRVKLADMNGDGLQDIVLVDFGQVAWWPSKGWGQWGVGSFCDATQTGANRHLSMGNAPYMAGFDASEVRVGDVNGDGMADLLRVRSTVVDIWLSRGTSFANRVMIQPAPFHTGFSNRVRLADVNGSGTRDILWGDAGQYKYIDLTGGIKPRLLVSVENGLGATTDITYESSVAQYLRSRAEGKEWFHTCPFPSQVVSQVVSRDNMGQAPPWPDGVYTTNYRYFDCHWDGEEHEFRGFGETLVESLGDENSPTSFTRHRFYQSTELDGRVDESLTGRAYMVETWGQSHLDPARTLPIYLSTAWTSYAVRFVDTSPASAGSVDARPGLHPDFWRRVRFAYATESHSFGFDTTAEESLTSYTPHTVSGLLAVRTEDPGGSVPDPSATTYMDLELPVGASLTTYIKSDTTVDDLAQTILARAHGRPGIDPVIEKHASYASNEAAWIHRVCESWAQEGSQVFQRKLEHYDDQTSSWSGSACQPAPSPGGQGSCQVGAKGLSTKGTYEECYEGARVREVEEHVTEYTRFGLPTHTQAFKKLEGWVYYEDPRGYQDVPTREVIRVGTDGATLDYPDTPVKYLSTRVSYDPGFGLITEYRDENDQKTLARYDALGRLSELWGPREPKSTDCAGGGNPVFMRVADVHYEITPGGNPYSYVRARTYEDACDPGNVKVAWSFTDGLGRTRLTVSEGDLPDQWIASGYGNLNARGQVRESFPPAYTILNTPGQAPFDGPVDLLPPVQPSCPTDEGGVCRNNVCPSTTYHDAFGRAVKQRLPDGTVTRTEYRGPLAIAAFDGNDTGEGPNANQAFVNTPTITRKDGHGRVLEVERVVIAGQDGYFTEYEWDGIGNLLSLRTCSTGQRFAACSGLGSVPIEKLQHFDSLGQRRVIEDPDAGTWTFVFDESGNLTDSFDGKWNAPDGGASGGPFGNHIRYFYDRANRLLQEACVQCESKPAGTILATYYYDAPITLRGGRGFMALTDDVATDEPQDWLLGRLSRIEDETGWVMMSYDRLGRQVAEVQHIEATIQRRDGTLLTLGTDVPQHIGRVRYDDAGRVTELVYPAPEGEEPMVVRREYNRRGLLRRIHGPDPLATVAQPGDPRPNYDYLIIDDPTGGPSDPRGYNEKGQRCGYRHGDASGITHLRTYDLNGRLRKASSKQTVSIAGRTTYDLFFKKYSYDGASNITRIDDLRDWYHVSEYTGGKNLPYDLDIRHDALDRVTQVSYERKPEELVSLPPGAPSARRVMRYAYSAVGNLLERSTTNGEGVENPEDEFYEKWLGPDIQPHPAHPHAFGSAIDPAAPTGTREVSATYDPNGNMTSLVVKNLATGRSDRFVYRWDQYDRLVAVEKWNDALAPAPDPGGGSGSPIAEAYYLYDSGGQRVIKHELTSDDTAGTGQDTLYVTEGLDLRNHHYERYVFDGPQRISRIGVAKPYDATAPPPAPALSTLTRLVFVSDHLGSTSLVVMDQDDPTATPTSDDHGCIVSTRSHLPYGGDEAESSAEPGCGQLIEEQYRFTGKEAEREIGIFYFTARYYNSSLGMFVSVDVASLFNNRNNHQYLYVDGQLFNAVDRDGNEPQSEQSKPATTEKTKEQVRRFSVQGMKAAQGSLEYLKEGEHGQLDQNFWTLDRRTGDWFKKEGVSSADAVRSIFVRRRGQTQKWQLECTGTLKAVLLYAILKTLSSGGDLAGEMKFNKMFPNLVLSGRNHAWGVSRFITGTSISRESSLAAGDAVYIRNDKRMTGLNQGLNAIVMKTKPKVEYQGLGMGGTLKEIVDNLRLSAVSVLGARVQVPGLARRVIRLRVEMIMNPPPQPKHDWGTSVMKSLVPGYVGPDEQGYPR